MDHSKLGAPEVMPPNEMLETFGRVNIAGHANGPVFKAPIPSPRFALRHHITHTPMIMAAEFSQSATAHHSNFTTSKEERGVFVIKEKPSRTRQIRGSLVAQYPANDPKGFADACELIHSHVGGVDLNCGMPVVLDTPHT
ncbi:hypothetical protein FRC07_002871 [Ceratobasidium sp. 392]|nr:hypothetical protein FRC07_002871 [Ceratobasidium sp. 392]